METKAIRVFYRIIDNQIIWTHTTSDSNGRIPAPFASTVEQDLAGIPNNKPDGITALGGIQDDYACVVGQYHPYSFQINDIATIDAFLTSDENTIVDGVLVIGAKRVVPVIYRYEVFSKEIIHPKLKTTKYLDYEVLEFNEELTTDEISSFEIELGRTIRKLE